MREFLKQIRWIDVAIGPLICGAFLGEILWLNQRFPVNLPGHPIVSFGEGDWAALYAAVLSVPVWYALWVISLHIARSRWIWATPVVVTVMTAALVNLSASSDLIVPLCLSYLVVAAVWSALPEVLRPTLGG
jgi:hypothetical protein